MISRGYNLPGTRKGFSGCCFRLIFTHPGDICEQKPTQGLVQLNFLSFEKSSIQSQKVKFNVSGTSQKSKSVVGLFGTVFAVFQL